MEKHAPTQIPCNQPYVLLPGYVTHMCMRWHRGRTLGLYGNAHCTVYADRELSFSITPQLSSHDRLHMHGRIPHLLQPDTL